MHPWKTINDHLTKEFKFKNFQEALDFTNQVGQIAEAMNHHPELTLSWGKVSLKIRTHSKDAITELDHKFAKACDAL